MAFHQRQSHSFLILIIAELLKQSDNKSNMSKSNRLGFIKCFCSRSPRSNLAILPDLTVTLSVVEWDNLKHTGYQKKGNIFWGDQQNCFQRLHWQQKDV